MDWKLQVVVVPVSDVDRARAFYQQVGFVLDHDTQVTSDVRVVQLTPPAPPAPSSSVRAWPRACPAR